MPKFAKASVISKKAFPLRGRQTLSSDLTQANDESAAKLAVPGRVSTKGLSMEWAHHHRSQSQPKDHMIR
jgi:hypothetical protein